MKKIISNLDLMTGKRLPFGYGIAWRDWARATYIAYPIHINFLVRGWRKIKESALFYSDSKREKDLADARNQGLREGLEAGKQAMRQELLNGLDSYLKERHQKVKDG